MKEYEVEVRRFGVLIVSGRFAAKSALGAVKQACREVVAVPFDSVVRDRLIDRYNQGWSGYSLHPDTGFCFLVRGL